MKVVIIGGGLSGSVLANKLANDGHFVDVLEQREKIGGNCSDSEIQLGNGSVIKSDYGVHIFHTNRKDIWDFVNQFGEFESHILQVQAKTRKGVLPLPINLNTLNTLGVHNLCNIFIDCKIGSDFETTFLSKFKDQILGKELFDLFIKDYTEKQWGMSVKDVPKSIVKRIPTRNTFDNRYFTDTYQGFPKLGFTNLIESMLHHSNISVINHRADLTDLKRFCKQYDHVVYCGGLDELFGHDLGVLGYRSLEWITFETPIDNTQGCLVMNDCTKDSEYTRSVEWKHLISNGSVDGSLVTFEYPKDYIVGENKPLYPINDEFNNDLYKKYLEKFEYISNKLIPLGRLAQYKYLDMDKTIEEALKIYEKITY